MISEIEKRKSVRKYEAKPISKEDMNIVKEAINDVQPILSKMHKVEYNIIIIEDGEKFSDSFKTVIGRVKAPHYLLIVSEEKEDYLENAGFIGEQVVLKLAEKGIGTCWLGSIANKKNKIRKIVKMDDQLTPIIVVAFGYPEEELKPIEKRKRKKLDKIFTGNIEKEFLPIAKALQVAPSALNSQPWRIFINDNVWNFYIKPRKGVLKNPYGHLLKIDAGIGITHILAEGTKKGYIINFSQSKIVNKIENLEYIITIRFGR